MKCEICERGDEDNTPLFRIGKYAPCEKPRWRCKEHIATDINKEVYRILKIVSNVEGKY